MTSGTRTKAQRERTAPQSSATETNAEPEPDQSPIEDPEEAPELRAADLGDPEEEWEWLLLPIRRSRVRVRALDSEEVMALQLLPDMTGFKELAMRMALRAAQGEKADKPTAQEEKDEAAAIQRQQSRYYKWLSHLALLDPDAPADPRTCEDCGLEHRRSQFTLKQVGRLHPTDQEAIGDFALRWQVLRVVTPFSEVQTLLDTALPAESSE